LYWDEVLEKIVFRAIRPNSGSEQITALTSQYNLLADSLKLKDIVDDRVNEVWVYYGVLDPSKNLSEDANYSNLYVASNVVNQSDVQNRDIRIKKILSRWITDRAAAIELGQRYLERFALAPVEADFMLDAKDSNLKLCDFVTIESKQKQDFTGSPLELLLQITKRVEKQTGTTWAFVARQFAFSSLVSPIRQVIIDGSNAADLLDLDLKAAHDARFAPAPSGTVIEFIIASGILISASTTANYALTNPSTWASGVIISLIIESGAVVAGRGGTGGRGADYNDSGGGIGGKGGDCANFEYGITIDNQGVISVGSGGGGGGGTGSDGFLSGVGGGGGGGFPHGEGGLHGTEYGFGDVQTVPQNGFNGTSTDSGNGGQGGRKSDDGDFGQGGSGGKGGIAYAQIGSTGGTGAGEDFNFGGLGGAAGDNAIAGNSFITWVNTGTIYGAIT